MSSFGQSCSVAWEATCIIADFAGKLMRHGQSLLLYPGARGFTDLAHEIMSPESFGLPQELVQLTCSDGIKVDALVVQNPHPRLGVCVLLFHGNGANYSMQLPMARAFWSMGCHCFLVSYRGFANSEGSPTEKGMRRDAAAAMDFISTHPVLGKAALVLYGQSMGGAVAIDTASRFPDRVAALIVENTFLSIPKMVPEVMPMLSKFTWLCMQRWPSEDSIQRIPQETPMLFLSGLQDEVVPSSHMQELHRIACSSRRSFDEEDHHQSSLFCGSSRSSSKDNVSDEGLIDRTTMLSQHRVIKVFETGHHNDTFLCNGYWTAVGEFLHRHCPVVFHESDDD